MALAEMIQTVLAEYGQATEEQLKDHELPAKLRDLVEQIRDLPPVAKRKDLVVKYSVGRGVWAKVPWIAFLDKRETASTQRGFYVVYLFHTNQDRAYLSFNQGVTEVQRALGGGKKQAREVARRAEAVRRALALPDKGPEADPLDLGAQGGLGRAYQPGNVWAKAYERDGIPSESELADDLELLLGLYDQYLAKRKELEPELEPVVSETAPAPTADTGDLESIQAALTKQKIVLPESLLHGAVIGLQAQPFSLYAGPTGTGKTQLAAALMSLPTTRGHILEVEGGWLDSASAFGYISPVSQDFVPGPVLLSLLEILEEPDEEVQQRPILILDEMNVSPPHVYLAPLLSSLERALSNQTPVPLLVAQAGTSEGARQALLAAEEMHPLLRTTEAGPFLRLVLDLPPELRIVGTLNFDASTEDLAPKLLSRSFVLWFEAPAIHDDLTLTANSTYGINPVSNPKLAVANSARALASAGIHVSARSLRRASAILDSSEEERKRYVDLLLSGLILPQIQTLTDETMPAGGFSESFYESIQGSFIAKRLRRMDQRVKDEGMASLWQIV